MEVNALLVGFTMRTCLCVFISVTVRFVSLLIDRSDELTSSSYLFFLFSAGWWFHITGDSKNNDSVVCYHFARVKNVNDNEKRCFFLGNAVVDCRVDFFHRRLRHDTISLSAFVACS